MSVIQYPDWHFFVPLFLLFTLGKRSCSLLATNGRLSGGPFRLLSLRFSPLEQVTPFPMGDCEWFFFLFLNFLLIPGVRSTLLSPLPAIGRACVLHHKSAASSTRRGTSKAVLQDFFFICMWEGTREICSFPHPHSHKHRHRIIIHGSEKMNQKLCFELSCTSSCPSTSVHPFLSYTSFGFGCRLAR